MSDTQRPQRMQGMIPASTKSRVIITSKEESYTFDRDAYREEFLKDIISKKDFDYVVLEASKQMGTSWSKKRLNDQIKIPSIVIYLCIVSVVLSIVYMITLYLAAVGKSPVTMFIISLISVIFASLIAFFLAIYYFCRKIEKIKTLDEIFQEELDRYFKKVNLKYAGILHWSFVSGKNYIECNILSRKPANCDEEPLQERELVDVNQGNEEQKESSGGEELENKKNK